MVLLRMRALKEDALTICLFINAIPAIALAPVTLGAFGAADLAYLPAFAMFGALGFSAWLLFTLAYARAPAQRIAPLEYTSLIWASGAGYFFFDETPGWRLWAGGAIIIGACLVVAFLDHFETRRKTEQPIGVLPD